MRTPWVSLRSRRSSLLGGILPFVLALGVLLPRTAEGEAAGPQAAPVPRLSQPSTVNPVAYLVSVGPGHAVWERFGHSLLWIHDPREVTDEAYNYGLFSFEQEHFLRRFIMGDMLYWMAGFDVQRQLAAYRSQHRSIEIQELALDSDQVNRLQQFLEWNDLPENRFYRYRYFRDNCSTRVRDALDQVLGGQLDRWARARVTDASYRDHVLRLTHDLFWVSSGMDFGLGPSADKPLTASEAMFVPMEMAQELRSFTVRTESGDSVPFIRAEQTFYDAGRPPVPDTTPRRIGTFVLVGLSLGGLFWWLGQRRGAAGLLLVAIPWLLLFGLLGTQIAFLWAFTDHVDTHWNANLLQASPLQMALGFTLWPLSRGRGWARRFGRWVAMGISVLAGLGFVLAVVMYVLPVVGQSNAEFLGLLLPPNLALAWVAWRMADPSHPSRGRAQKVSKRPPRKRKRK